MRPRFILVIILIALAAAVLAMAMVPNRPEHRHERRAPTAIAPMPRALDLGPSGDEPISGWVEDVIPMHRAVRLAMHRFGGKVLDIALVPAPSGTPNSYPLVYRIRILTRSRDVLDIRMDAFTGRFLELRGADIAAARRGGQEKDD